MSYFSTFEANTVLVFGLLLMFGVLGGMLAHRVRWMPTITAFMILGFLIGPHGLRLINKSMLYSSTILVDIALGLILYKLGNMLHPKQMMRSRKLAYMTVAETTLTFVCVTATIYIIGYDLLLSTIIGSIAISSSPAVLVHVASELNAKGIVTDRAKSLVALNNLIAFFVFSLILPFAMAGNEQESLSNIILIPFYRLFGAILIGVAIGWVAVQVARMIPKKDQHYRFAVVAGAVMMTLGLAQMLQTSALLAPLIMGMSTRWFETSKYNLSKIGLGEGGDLFFIVLFVMAGAKIDPKHMLKAGLVAVVLVLVRCAAKMIGIFSVMRVTKSTPVQSFSTGLLLIPMAGMAIGLVATTSQLVPEMGSRITAIVFAMIAIFETIGPFVAAYALRRCGEAQEETEEESLELAPNSL